MDLISIIVPIYNSELYLEKCINSLVNQTYENIEIILVNDGSKDSSFKICKKYERLDKRVTVLTQQNEGVSSARNYGLRESNGEFVTFVDSDDFVEPFYCEIMMNNIKRKNVDMVYYGQSRIFSNNHLKKVTVRIQEGIYSSDFIINNQIDDGTLSGFLLHSSCATLYKNNVLVNNNVLFNESIKHNEDGLFNLMYCLHVENVYINQNKTIYYYRSNPDSASNNMLDVKNRYSQLDKILKNLAKNYPTYNFYQQLQRRNIKLLLEQMAISSKQPYDEWVDSIINIERTIETSHYSLLNYRNLNQKKKIFIWLLKKQKYKFIYAALKIFN